ncbi:TrkH family potassium uptake protein [Cellulophaga fucicola]|uniref:Trk-type K+ transport system, membrane component n=1 Tax=Cellulophaga fucicola TaxID=76595 RepID=A0A1K1MTY3_9FLAO|nr:potassium transporter TrkG [Cellulophaga fucicola]SFW26545.1 Trk-type K+ transport system, membrane component [Cellulophaga fucicola]
MSFLNNYINYFKQLYRIAFICSVLGLLLFVIDFGYDKSSQLQYIFNIYYFIVIALGILATILRYIKRHKTIKLGVLIFDSLTILVTLTILYAHFLGEEAHKHISFLYNDNWVKFAIILTFIREFSEQNVNYKRTVFNPAQLFIISFLGIIFMGTLLLMLPNATYTSISFLDALFTATSSVCVTGLIVVDTGSYFTTFGQSVILFLIQAGGIGILTVASYFSYFFKGGASYENQLSLSDITGSSKLGEVFSTLKRILIITFSIEILATLLIYTSVDKSLFSSFFERCFFSLFHSVSAFCNAGFSTLPNSLYQTGFKNNYMLHSILMGSFILGGLGFPIVVNLIKYLKYFFVRKLFYLSGKKETHKPWVLNINSRITLVTTTALTIVGTIIFYSNEYNNTLKEHSGIGKFVTALFGAATPRTAGFNTIDMSALNFSTIMLIFLLMWVGASPASTGGGIKTNTFAIATLNFLSLAKGKSKIEVFRREIAEVSVRRAFAVISLSLLVIGTGIIMISIFDNDKKLLDIAFECFSAYSTVGLSLGITAKLSAASKVVIIGIMFIGRVSMLTLLIALVKKTKQRNYKYPTEELTIN